MNAATPSLIEVLLTVLCIFVLMYHLWVWGMMGCSWMDSTEKEVATDWSWRGYEAAVFAVGFALLGFYLAAGSCAVMVVVVILARRGQKKLEAKKLDPK